MGIPTGGTFTLAYGGETTEGIAYNAAASTVAAALDALTGLTGIAGAGGPAFWTSVDLTLPTGQSGAITAFDYTTGGTESSIARSTKRAYIAGVQEVDSFSLSAGVTGGTWKLSYDSGVTWSYNFSATESNANIQTEIGTLSGGGECLLGATPGPPWEVTFTVPAPHAGVMVNGDLLEGTEPSVSVNRDVEGVSEVLMQQRLTYTYTIVPATIEPHHRIRQWACM